MKSDVRRYVSIFGMTVTQENSAEQFLVWHGRPFSNKRWIGKVLNRKEYSVFSTKSIINGGVFRRS